MVNVSLLIIRDTLLEEVGFALKGNHIHEVKRIRLVVNLLVPKRHQESVSDEFDILAHEVRVYANQLHGEGV